MAPRAQHQPSMVACDTSEMIERADAAETLCSDEETTGSSEERTSPAAWLTPRLVVMSLGVLLALLAMCGAVLAAFVYMRPNEPAVTAYEGPQLEDIRELLKVVKQVYPDGEPFKHLKFLDVDDTDPNNIKFELKKSRFPNQTAARARVLDDSPFMANLNYAMCGIDGAQSALTVGQLVTNIKSAAEACANPYPVNGNQQDFCAQMVSLDIALWGFLACYIEDMVSTCTNQFNAHAVCALDVTGILTNGALVAEGAAGAKQNCMPPGGYKTTTALPKEVLDGLSKGEVNDLNNAFEKMNDVDEEEFQEERVWQGPGSGIRRLNSSATMTRRLQQTPPEEAKSWKQAACGLDTTKAAARVAQVGVLTAKMTNDCSKENIITQSGKNLCAVDVTGAIASAGIAASLITVSVVNCPAALEFTKQMGEQFCAASIIDLVTAVTYMSTSIVDIDSTCGMIATASRTGQRLAQLEAMVKSFRSA